MRADTGFEAMGTHVHVLVVATDERAAARLLQFATERIEQLEARWSRFRPTSEISRLNASAGTPCVVSADTVRLVESMRLGYAVTNGAYDPTVLHDLCTLGYDRDFQCVVAPAYTAAKRRTGDGARRAGGFDGVVVSRASGLVWLPAGTGIDPGGIGKGLAADMVVEELVGAGASGALVNIGGDLRVMGLPDDGDRWIVDVDDPHSGEPATKVALVDGALATSSTRRRAWQHDGEVVHHLIDPATGMPADADVAGVSVIAAEAWRAEVLTKAVVVTGAARGGQLVERLGAAMRAVAPDGRVHANAAWTPYELVLASTARTVA
jgi:thiamine biosynthesis lipoprotein